MSKQTVESPSGWRRWVVLLSSILSLFLGGSLSYCSGVFHVALLRHYQHDLVETAWLGSLFSCMFAVTGPVASLAINLFSCRTCVMAGSLLILLGFTISSFMTDMRWLFLTYAILGGTGEGMVYTGSQIVVGYYFPDRASMAAGCAMGGIAMGTFVFPPFSQFLLDHYGLHGCFLLLGAVGFQAAVFGALMTPCDVELQVKHSNNSGKSFLEKVATSFFGDADNIRDLLSPAFIVFLISAFCMCVGNYITYLFMPDYFIKQGSPSSEASLLVSVVGIGGCFSRTLSGFAASDERIGPLLVYPTTYGIAAIIEFFTQPMAATVATRAAYAFMFGLYASPGWVLFTPITIHIVGIRNLASAFGTVMFSSGLGTLVGPPVAGIIAETYGDYKEGFYFAGAAFCVTSICGFIMALTVKPASKEAEDIGKIGEHQSMLFEEKPVTLVISPPVDHIDNSVTNTKAPLQSDEVIDL